MPASSVARRIVYLVAALAPAWALIAAFTGGVGWVIGPLRVSSREPLRPLLVGLAAAAYYLWRYTRDERADDGRWLEARVKPAAPMGDSAHRQSWIRTGGVLRKLRGCGIGFVWVRQSGTPMAGRNAACRAAIGGTAVVAKPRVGVCTRLDIDRIPETERSSRLTRQACRWSWRCSSVCLVTNGPFFVVPVFAALTLWLTYLLGKEATGSKVAAVLATFIAARIARVSRTSDGADVRRTRRCRVDARCSAWC